MRPEPTGGLGPGSEHRAHSALCQKVALNATVAGDVALLHIRRNNAAGPMLCHTGRDNYSDGITTIVVAVIISNRRDLIVSPQGGGLLPWASAARVRCGDTGGGGAQILLLLSFSAFIVIAGVRNLNKNKTLPELNRW